MKRGHSLRAGSVERSRKLDGFHDASVSFFPSQTDVRGLKLGQAFQNTGRIARGQRDSRILKTQIKTHAALFLKGDQTRGQRRDIGRDKGQIGLERKIGEFHASIQQLRQILKRFGNIAFGRQIQRGRAFGRHFKVVKTHARGLSSEQAADNRIHRLIHFIHIRLVWLGNIDNAGKHHIGQFGLVNHRGHIFMPTRFGNIRDIQRHQASCAFKARKHLRCGGRIRRLQRALDAESQCLGLFKDGRHLRRRGRSHGNIAEIQAHKTRGALEAFQHGLG